MVMYLCVKGIEYSYFILEMIRQCGIVSLSFYYSQQLHRFTENSEFTKNTRTVVKEIQIFIQFKHVQMQMEYKQLALSVIFSICCNLLISIFGHLISIFELQVWDPKSPEPSCVQAGIHRMYTIGIFEFYSRMVQTILFYYECTHYLIGKYNDVVFFCSGQLINWWNEPIIFV